MQCLECGTPLDRCGALAEKPRSKPVRNITIGCGVVIVDGTGGILTLRRLGGWWPGHLALVGGHPEEGEGVVACAVREAFEEAGVLVAPRVVNGHSLIFHANEWISQDPYKHHFSVYVVADHVGGAVVNREPDKHKDLFWYNLDDIVELSLSEDMPLIPIHAIEQYRQEIGV